MVDEASELHRTVVIDPLGDGSAGAGFKMLARRGRLVIFGTSAEPEGTVHRIRVLRPAGGASKVASWSRRGGPSGENI